MKKQLKKTLSLILSLMMIMSMFAGLEISSSAEEDGIISAQKQELINFEIDENKFRQIELPFNKDSVIAHHNKGDYILFITAELKDGTPIDEQYEKKMSDIDYTLYSTKDYNEFKSYSLEPEYDESLVQYPFYFNEFYITYVAEKKLYYISNSIKQYYYDPPFHYTYGAFFDGEKVSVVDKNIARDELKKVGDKYVLVEKNPSGHIIDVKITERIDEESAYYDVSVCPYYYVSEDLKTWTYTQGPVHTVNTMYFDNEIPKLGFSFDSLMYAFSLEDTTNNILCFRYFRNRSGDTTWDDYSYIYCSYDTVNFIELEGISDKYAVGYVCNIFSKTYAFVWDYSNYDWRLKELSIAFIEYDSDGNISNIIFEEQSIVSDHAFMFHVDDELLQVGHNNKKQNKEDTEYVIYDIFSDGISNSFISKIDMSKVAFPFDDLGKSELAFTVYEDNSILIFEDFHTVYRIEMPFTFSTANSIDGDLVFVGDKIYAISINEVLEIIGMGPVDEPPVEEPPVEEPADNGQLEVKGEGGITTDFESKISQIAKEQTAEAISEMIENDNFAIVDKNGNAVADNAFVGTGSKIQILDDNGDVINEYEIVVPTDIDGNGKTTAADARLALRTSAQLENLEGVYFESADITGDGKITASDARKILRIAANLEK